MSDPPDDTKECRYALTMDFLRTELATALVFATLAGHYRKSGRHDRADRALSDAENGFEEIVRFLYDPKNAKYTTASERGDLKHQIRLLRKILDAVKPSHR